MTFRYVCCDNRVFKTRLSFVDSSFFHRIAVCSYEIPFEWFATVVVHCNWCITRIFMLCQTAIISIFNALTSHDAFVGFLSNFAVKTRCDHSFQSLFTFSVSNKCQTCSLVSPLLNVVARSFAFQSRIESFVARTFEPFSLSEFVLAAFRN